MPTALRRRWPLAAALLITAFGAALRLDAYTQKYGTLQRPAWARFMTEGVAPAARHLRPSTFVWPPIPQPYVGGDPINYLRFGREMTTFYQPHVREPVFLAATRVALWALDGQDAAVSLASAAGSLLAVFATYLLGAALIDRSRIWALAAALLMAIEYENITWAVDGWRDDMFTGTFVLAAWALVRLRDRPTFGNALLVGFTGGAAALTRITALSFLLPALLWIGLAPLLHRIRASLDRPRGVNAGVTYTAVAFVILAAVVAPFLVSCAIATGDPFFAINYHTAPFRFAEGLPAAKPMGVGGYLALKFASHPVAMFDVGVTGLLVRPFETKWTGFDLWLPRLGALLSWAALAGMAIWIFSPRGRLVLLILVTSLAPVAFTWNVGGGGEWRYTMHTYPIYIVAAAYAGAAVLSREWWPSRRAVARRGVMTATLGAAAAAVYVALPWFTAQAAIARREAAMFEAGGRDVVFFREGWSSPRQEGAVTTRVSLEPHARLHFPLPSRRDYEFILRFDPVAPDTQHEVTVLFNRQLAGRLRLTWDPARVGSYRLRIPASRVRPGENEITLVPDTMVPAGSAAAQFAWLDPSRPIGIRFWYLRVPD